MKTRLQALLLVLSLIGSPAHAKNPRETIMNLGSPDFREGGSIPERFTCDGKNLSPSLKIDGVPKEARSLILVVDDPDAPGGNFTHWLMWNIAPDVAGIATNSLPTHAVQGVNDFGKNKYSGPCPPSGTHRYFFRLYALDKSLVLPSSSKRDALDSAMRGHVISEATLVGTYTRKAGKR